MGYIETAHDAGQNAAIRMRELGFTEARVTTRGPDGGIDVRAPEAVAQVKYWNKPVGTPDLQRLYGARANNHHQQMLFFARSGFSKGARDYADIHGIALFTFDHAGAVSAVNDSARSLVKQSHGTRNSPAPATRNTRPPTRHNAEPKRRSEPYVVLPTDNPGRLRTISVNRANAQLRKLGFSQGSFQSYYSSSRGRSDSEFRTENAVARVRIVNDVVDVPDLMNLYESPEAQSKEKFFFSHNGYSNEAVMYANSARIALFVIDPKGGTTPANNRARILENTAQHSGPLPTTSLAGQSKYHTPAISRTATPRRGVEVPSQRTRSRFEPRHATVLTIAGFVLFLTAVATYSLGTGIAILLLALVCLLTGTVCAVAGLHSLTTRSDPRSDQQ